MRFVLTRVDVVNAAFVPACWNSTFTGPMPYAHHTVRIPEPYGSPSAPAWVICVCTFAAVTGDGNAGTVSCSVPTYFDVLVTSFWKPPVAAHCVPTSSGSTSVGE